MFAGIDQLGLFIFAGLLLNLTPGPDVLYIVSSGVRGGRRAGIVAALGIGAGCCVHIVAAAVGLGALIAASATAFTVLKWLGAAYLLYIGLGMLLARSGGTGALAGLAARTPAQADRVVPLLRVFRKGFWTNALNPKVALFFLAFVPQFIAHDASHKTATFLLLGLIFNVNALPVNLAWGLGAAWLAGRLQRLRGSLAWLDRIAGAFFIYFGVRLATAEPFATSP
ncbi:MAG: LysE family translocator [Betaproteobacteria bacterium]